MFETNIAEFPILKERYNRRFYGKILSHYLIFLFDLSDRLDQDPAEMTKDFLALLYTEKTEVLSKYSIALLELLIYGESTEISSKEILFLMSGQKLFLAFVHGFLSMKSFSDVKIQLELFRLAGLLIVNDRPNLSKKQRNPVLLDFTYGVFNYSTEAILQDSIANYTTDFKNSANHLNKVKGFGRSYNAATDEFEKFLEKFPLCYEKFLSPQLKIILAHCYRVYRKKTHFPVTGLINHLQTNSPSLGVYNANLKLKYSIEGFNS